MICDDSVYRCELWLVMSLFGYELWSVMILSIGVNYG